MNGYLMDVLYLFLYIRSIRLICVTLFRVVSEVRNTDRTDKTDLEWIFIFILCIHYIRLIRAPSPVVTN